jgi:hypothetical protein
LLVLLLLLLFQYCIVGIIKQTEFAHFGACVRNNVVYLVPYLRVIRCDRKRLL